MKDRVDDQIKYYSGQSNFNKFRYRRFQIIVIIAGGIIPLISLTASAFSEWWQHGALIISAVLGSIITIITAFSQMEKYFETWTLYRTTEESLKREKFLFNNNAGDYFGVADKNRVLVERVETILSSENSKFFALQQQTRQPTQQQAATQQAKPKDITPAADQKPKDITPAADQKPKEITPAADQKPKEITPAADQNNKEENE
jgi:ABC-type multidrug transport system fused ATPase/permease subunit